MKSGVDLVVVNYQTPWDLEEFLDELHVENLPYNLTIVNVEPEKSDATVALRYVDSKPNVEYIAFPANVGYACAVNRAAAGGERGVIGIFNADVRCLPGTIEACVLQLLSHPEWAVLGPRQVDQFGRITHAGIFGTNTEPKMRGWRSQGGGYEDVRDDAVSVMGSAYFVQRSAWDELRRCDGNEGAFLPTPLYYEETWCSYHARAHGWKVAYYGESTMIHKWHQAINKKGEGWASQQFKLSREQFRSACDAHGIEHD